jgi:hypothetical protein
MRPRPGLACGSLLSAKTRPTREPRWKVSIGVENLPLCVAAGVAGTKSSSVPGFMMKSRGRRPSDWMASRFQIGTAIPRVVKEILRRAITEVNTDAARRDNDHSPKSSYRYRIMLAHMASLSEDNRAAVCGPN